MWILSSPCCCTFAEERKKKSTFCASVYPPLFLCLNYSHKWNFLQNSLANVFGVVCSLCVTTDEDGCLWGEMITYAGGSARAVDTISTILPSCSTSMCSIRAGKICCVHGSSRLYSTGLVGRKRSIQNPPKAKKLVSRNHKTNIPKCEMFKQMHGCMHACEHHWIQKQCTMFKHHWIQYMNSETTAFCRWSFSLSLYLWMLKSIAYR